MDKFASTIGSLLVFGSGTVIGFLTPVPSDLKVCSIYMYAFFFFVVLFYHHYFSSFLPQQHCLHDVVNFKWLLEGELYSRTAKQCFRWHIFFCLVYFILASGLPLLVYLFSYFRLLLSFCSDPWTSVSKL